MDLALRKAQEDCTESYLLTEGLKLERELNAANAEIRSLKYNIDRVMGMYASKDNQICNLLNICRANGIDVSSQDLIHGKEDKL
jgi:hypothetical protein